MLTEAQAALRPRLARTAGNEAERKRSLARLTEADAERERVIAMYRRGRLTDAEADRELDDIARAAGDARADLERLNAEERLASAAEEHLTSVAAGMAKLRETVETIEATGDTTAMQTVIAALVRGVEVITEREGRTKRAKVRVELALAGTPTSAVDLLNGRSSATPA
jgi:hypothetical protein